MANYFFSQVNPEQVGGILDETTGNIHSGTATTAGDKLELRWDQTVSRFQVEKFLHLALRWLKNGGANSAGANMGNP